jgi:hypothetical protein
VDPLGLWDVCERQKARIELRKKGLIGPGQSPDEYAHLIEAYLEGDPEVLEWIEAYRSEVRAEAIQGGLEGGYDGGVGVLAALMDEFTFGLGGDYVVLALAIDEQYAEMGRTSAEYSILVIQATATGGAAVAAKKAGQQAVKRGVKEAVQDVPTRRGPDVRTLSPVKDPAPPSYKRGHPGQPVTDHVRARAAGGHPTDPANLHTKPWEWNARKGNYEGQLLKARRRLVEQGLTPQQADEVLAGEWRWLQNDVMPRPMDPDMLDTLASPGSRQ